MAYCQECADLSRDLSEALRQLAHYRKAINRMDDRVEYARDSLSRADIHAILAELTRGLANKETP